MNKSQDDVTRRRIIEVLQWLSSEEAMNDKQYTTHERWDRIYPMLKQLGWKYRRGGLEAFVYQPPLEAQWMSCEAAATYFESTLPGGVTLVERLVSKERGTTTMQQVLSIANRKKKAVKASTVNESVVPNPLVSSASSVPMQQPISTTVDNVVHSLPSDEPSLAFLTDDLLDNGITATVTAPLLWPCEDGQQYRMLEFTYAMEQGGDDSDMSQVREVYEAIQATKRISLRL